LNGTQYETSSVVKGCGCVWFIDWYSSTKALTGIVKLCNYFRS